MSSNFSLCGNSTVSGTAAVLYLLYEDRVRYFSSMFSSWSFKQVAGAMWLQMVCSVGSRSSGRNQEKSSFWSFICEISGRHLEITEIMDQLQLWSSNSFFKFFLRYNWFPREPPSNCKSTERPPGLQDCSHAQSWWSLPRKLQVWCGEQTCVLLYLPYTPCTLFFLNLLWLVSIYCS